jgi:hypothetical protein
VIRGKSQIAIENRGRRKAAPFFMRVRAGPPRNGLASRWEGKIFSHATRDAGRAMVANRTDEVVLFYQ